jgi:hypothetical protein
MIAPCVTALRHLSTSIANILGSDQGTKHALADLSTDIELLMDSLDEHDVYQIKGRVFAEGDGSPTPDVITVGIQQLTDSSSNPLTEYNAAFVKLQRRRRLGPLVSSWSDAEIPADHVPESSTSHPSPPASSIPSTNIIEMEIDPESESGSESGSDGSDNFMVIDEPDQELVSAFGRTMDEADEPTLTRNNADDVALDMDGGDSGFLCAGEADLYADLDLAGFIIDDVDDLDYNESY